ncbi:MAG: hypothetical protein J1F35_01215 [Erysipelotrichales bacterium]|nr:hypothetical protein [Erysipelotrichales bacterium]
MANDVYGRRNMYTGGGFLILIIPFGMIAIFFLYDLFMNTYKQYTLNKATEEILLQVLNRDGLETPEEYKEYALRVVKDKEYDPEEASFTKDEDMYYLTIYDRYTSIIGELSFGLFKNREIMVRSSYVGYYNEYKEAVAEKYIETDFEEDYGEYEEEIQIG